MTNVIAPIVGIFAFVHACKSIGKTYSKKSSAFKAWVGIGLFIGSALLAFLFMYTLNPDASPEKMGENSYIFIGFFASLIASVLKVIQTKKGGKKTRKAFKSAVIELLIMILIILITLGLLFGIDLFTRAAY